MQIIVHRDLNTKEARAITQRIKSKMGDLMGEVAKAWIGRVWLALAYESWEDYVKGEFNHAPLTLPREERKAVASLLRGQGMSTRAIGSATGVSDETIRRDLSDATNVAPDEVVPVTGLDGKTYPPKRKPKPEPRPDVPAPQPKPEPPPPPAWCASGATGEQWQLAKGGTAYAWTQPVGGDDVWITCEDYFKDGRVERSEPRIHVHFTVIGDDGIDPAAARQLAAALIAAADLLNPPSA
jgi:hypothetical protein